MQFISWTLSLDVAHTNMSHRTIPHSLAGKWKLHRLLAEIVHALSRLTNAITTDVFLIAIDGLKSKIMYREVV